MSAPSPTLATLVEGMVKSIDETRRLATKVPVDTSSFLTMAFYIGELRDVLTHLNTKRDVKSVPDGLTGMQRLKSAIDDLRNVTKHNSECSRLFLVFDTAKVVTDLQRLLQEVGHDLNLMPVLSIMSSLPSDVANKLTDLRSRMRVATFDSEPEVLELSREMEDAVFKSNKKLATDSMAKLFKLLGLTSQVADALKEEVQRDLVVAEKDERWMDVDKLQELNSLLSLASISKSDPIKVSFSRLALQIKKDLGVETPAHFKCAMTGEVMKDPVSLKETGETFNRTVIESWFAKGKRSCPKTGKMLRNTELIPNAAVRKEMEEEYDKLNQQALEEAVKRLKEEGETAAKEGGERMELALEAMQQLSGLDNKYAVRLLEMETIPPLVKFITDAEPGKLREIALLTLANIASMGDEQAQAIAEAGGILPIVGVIKDDNAADISAGLQLVLELSRCASLREPLAVNEGIHELIKLLHRHKDDAEGKDAVKKATEAVLEVHWRKNPDVALDMAEALMFKPLVECLGEDQPMDVRTAMADAVWTWGVSKASRVSLVQLGVLPPLVAVLNDGSNQAKAAAARAIEHLSHTDINRMALAKAGVIPALVKALARGTPTVKEAAQATLANLAMDDQDLDSLDEDGTAVRLITMLRAGPASNRDYAVRTLECMVRESKTMRSAVMEDDGAVPAVFDVLVESAGHFGAAGSLRSSALLLLMQLSFEPGSAEVFANAAPEVVAALGTLLSRPLPAEEREAIVVILCTLAGDKKMRALVRKEEQLWPAMNKVMQSGTQKSQEAVLRGLSHLADPEDLDTQLAVARLGVIPVAVHYLKMGPDVMRIPSAVLLGNLALSTPHLSEQAKEDRRLSKGWRLSFARSNSARTSVPERSSDRLSGSTSPLPTSMMMPNHTSPGDKVEKLRSCKVHSGKCSLDATFCLVEGDLVGVLLELIRRSSDNVAGVCLAAVASLLAGDEDQERAADYLVKLDVIEAAAGCVGKSTQLTKWAVCVLERIFAFKKYQATKYSQPAVTALGRFMTTATGPARKTAAETLMRLNILPKGSLSGEL